jgi:hypothetical protein
MVMATTLYRAAGLDELESSIPAAGKQKAPTGVIKAWDDHRIEPRLPSSQRLLPNPGRLQNGFNIDIFYPPIIQ